MRPLLRLTYQFNLDRTSTESQHNWSAQLTLLYQRRHHHTSAVDLPSLAPWLTNKGKSAEFHFISLHTHSLSHEHTRRSIKNGNTHLKKLSYSREVKHRSCNFANATSAWLARTCLLLCYKCPWFPFCTWILDSFIRLPPSPLLILYIETLRTSLRLCAAGERPLA